MKYTIRHINQIEWRQWCNQAEDLPFTCDPDWALALEIGYNGKYKAIPWLINYDDGEELVIGYEEVAEPLPKLSLSPFGLYCGIARQGGTLHHEATIYRIMRKYSFRYRSITYQLPFYAPPSFEISSLQRVQKDTLSTHVLNLDTTYEALFTTRFKGATRTCIRRAQKERVQTMTSREIKYIHGYYEMHSHLAGQRGNYGGLHPESFFINLIQKSQRCELALALVDEKIISGGIFLDDGPTTFYWHGATDRDYVRLQPNYALLSTVIQKSIRNGKKFFNLGGSAHIASLENFKASWGATPQNYAVGSSTHPLIYSLKALMRLSGSKASNLTISSTL